MDSIKEEWLDTLAEYILTCFEYDPRLLRPMTPETIMDSIYRIYDTPKYRGTDLRRLAEDCIWCDLGVLQGCVEKLIPCSMVRDGDDEWYGYAPSTEYEQELLDVYNQWLAFVINNDYPYYVIQAHPELVIVTSEEIQNVIDSIFS